MKTRATRGAMIGACLMVSLTRPLVAQQNLTFELGGTAGPTWLSRSGDDLAESLSGLIVGLEARAAIWRTMLDLRYLQGGISSAERGIDRDLVEAEIMLSFFPVRFLAIKLGPHIRSIVVPEGTIRSVFWEGRLHGEVRLLGRELRGYVELWNVFGGGVDQASFDGGEGLEGGLWVEPTASRLWGRFGYRIDQTRVTERSLAQTVEFLTLTVGVRLGSR